MQRVAPGLPADWLTSWLAAVGVTVLVPGSRLSWTDDPVPLARLEIPDDKTIEDEIVARWPTDDLDGLPFARELEGHAELRLNPSVEAWRERAETFRNVQNSWMLSSLYTDLSWSQQDKVYVIERAGLHTPMPAGRTLHQRLQALVTQIDSVGVRDTLDGVGQRERGAGLAFDVTRLGSLADKSDPLVDPVLDVLALFGLALLPCRGVEIGGMLRRQQRGFIRTGARQVFHWSTWDIPFDRWGIDAFLDQRPWRVPRPPATGAWAIAAYAPRGSADVTRAFGARRVW